jgi:hypothetical protein
VAWWPMIISYRMRARQEASRRRIRRVEKGKVGLPLLRYTARVRGPHALFYEDLMNAASTNRRPPVRQDEVLHG